MTDDEEIKYGRPLEPDEPPYESNWRPRLYWAVVAAIVSPIVVEGPISAALHASHDPGFLGSLFIACIETTKFCLMAAWLAWGGSRAFVRIIVVFISLFITCVVFGARSGEVTQAWAFIFLGTVGLASVVALPRLFGVRWIPGEEMLPDGRVVQRAEYRRSRQFTLVDMFVWTLTVAVVAGILRGLGLPPDFERGNPLELLLVFALGIAAPAAGTLLCLWAAMSRDPQVGRRTMLSLGAMYLLTSPVWMLALLAGRGPESAIAAFSIFGMITLSMLMTIRCLLLPRGFGDRMVRFRGGKPVERPYQLDVSPPFGRPIPD